MERKIIWRPHVTRVQSGGNMFDVGPRPLLSAVLVAKELGFTLDVPEDAREEMERHSAALNASNGPA